MGEDWFERQEEKKRLRREKVILFRKKQKMLKEINPIPFVLRTLKLRAKKKKIDFNLEEIDLVPIFKNSVKCIYCGEIVKNMSVDRIDSNKGYIKGNIAPACCKCNQMKWNTPLEEFILRCKRIAKNNE